MNKDYIEKLRYYHSSNAGFKNDSMINLL